jgi:hypothetical protein
MLVWMRARSIGPSRRDNAECGPSPIVVEPPACHKPPTEAASKGAGDNAGPGLAQQESGQPGLTTFACWIPTPT